MIKVCGLAYSTLLARTLFYAHTNLFLAKEGKQQCDHMNHAYKFHARLIKSGKHTDLPSLRQLLLLSCTSSSTPETLSYATSIFNHIPSPDTFSYNTIIRAHGHHSPLQALSFFANMRTIGVSPPDHFTFPFVLKSCARLQLGRQGGVLHSLIFKLGFDSDVFVRNGLINCYGCCGSVELALKVFDETPERRDVVSWSSMIACFANNGFGYEALDLFQKMQLENNVKPDEVTMLSVVSAVSSFGELELGRWVDRFICRSGLNLTVALGTALIDMYSRCGSISDSIRVFDEMPYRNVLTSTALINGLAVHGRGREALGIFYELKNSDVHRPDYITFTGVLVACSHSGLIDEGWKVFESMKNEYGMEPMLEHYGCMVDLLGRAGLLYEAYQFVQRMPIRPNSVVWRTLLGACASHNHVELAEKVKERVYELDPHHDGDYVLLSNAYGGVGRWAEKEGLRKSMRKTRINKKPGYSLISIEQEFHEFVAGDTVHPRSEEIKAFLDSLIDRLRLDGYIPKTSNVLFDVEEEEKEHSLGYHSEKLAAAFALLCFDDKRTIRIIKNLRICHDCHNFMKHVSIMFNRKIIVRDRNRFHHFSKGSCSCRDYW